MNMVSARTPALLVLPALLGAVIVLLATSVYGTGVTVIPSTTTMPAKTCSRSAGLSPHLPLVRRRRSPTSRHSIQWFGAPFICLRPASSAASHF